jgi:hypothetical protein
MMELRTHWAQLAKWQRQLLVLGAALAGFLLLNYAVLVPFQRLAHRQTEQYLDQQFQTGPTPAAVIDGMATAEETSLERSVHTTCAAEADALTSPSDELPIVWSPGDPDPQFHVKLETYLGCTMKRSPERLCDADNKARFVAKVRTYLARLAEVRAEYLQLAVLEKLQSPGMRGLNKTFESVTQELTAAHELPVVATEDAWGESLTPEEIAERQRAALAERRAIVREVSRVDGPPESFNDDLRNLARNGFVTASDFGGWLGFGVPTPITRALDGVVAERSSCS